MPTTLSDPTNSLSQVQTDDLIAAMKTDCGQFVQDTLAFMNRNADRVRELIKRGVDVRKINAPFIERFYAIATSRLLPELGAAVDEELYGIGYKLPLSEQRKLLDDAPFRVIDIESMDVTNCRKVNFSNMTPIERKMVFGPYGTREPEAQIVWVRGEKQKRAIEEVQITDIWKVNKKKKEVVISGPMRLDAKLLHQMLAALDG